jgi:transcriptional regulator with XRE-family HTH domain
VNFVSRENLIKRLLADKKYRDSYVESFVRNGIAFQLRSMRDLRDLTQMDLAELAEKKQSVISRLENPDNGNPNIATLIEMASALDVALLVKFVPYSRLLKEYEDTTPHALNAKSIADDVHGLSVWVSDTVEAKNTVPARLQLVNFSTPRTPVQTSLPLHVPRLVKRIPTRLVTHGGNYVAPTNAIKFDIRAAMIFSEDSTFRIAGGR